LQNLNMTAAIESPRFDGQTMRAIASGWRLAGSFRALTGPWLTISTGADIALNGQAGTQRADVVAGADPYADQSINPANGGIRFLNPAAFAQPAAGTLGNSVRNSIRGPGTKVVDMALSRNFHVTGSQSLELRAEAFNAFNWFQWGQPSVARNSATFGQITSSSNVIFPRIIQLAVKYAF